MFLGTTLKEYFLTGQTFQQVFIALLCFWERHSTPYFLTGTLCGVEDKQAHESVSQRHLPEKKKADMVLLVSPKVGLDNHYLSLTSMTLSHESGG